MLDHRTLRGKLRASLHDRPAISLVALVAAILLAFSPWWLGNRLFAPLDILHELYEPWAAGDPDVEVLNHFTTDSVTQVLIYHRFAQESFAADGQIGWNSLEFGGIPAYANTSAGFADWSMQLHRVFDYWAAWHLGLISQFLVAGSGMWMFLRSQGIKSWLATLGGLAYAGNSQFIIWIYHRWALAAFAWIPWMLWAMFKWHAGARKMWWLVPLTMALAFVGGSLQHNAYVLLVVLVVVASWLSSPHPGRWRLVGHAAAWAILGWSLAAFSELPETLAFFDNLRTGQARGAIGEGWSLPGIIRSVGFMVLQPFPSLLGSPRSLDAGRLLDRGLFDIAFFGLIPTVVAYRTLILRQAPLAARLLMATGLIVPLTPLVGPLYFRVQILFVVGGIWAFTWYWQNWTPSAGSTRKLFITGGLALTAASGFSLLVSLYRERLERTAAAFIESQLAAGEATFGVYRTWMLERAQRFVAELPLWSSRHLPFLIAGGAGLVALILRRRRPVPATAILASALLVELAAFAGGWVSVIDPQRFPPYPLTVDLGAVQHIVAGERVFVVQDPGRPRLLPPNTLAWYGVANIEEYESIRSPSMWQAAEFRADSQTLGSLAVGYAISYPDKSDIGNGWELAYRGQTLAVWKNSNSLPRYLGLPDSTPWDDPRELLARPGRPVEAAAGSTDNRRYLQVPREVGAVRVAENWSEGWLYRLAEGAWQEVERANDASMLIPIASSTIEQEVEMVYSPRRRTYGAALTGAASIAALVTALVAWRPGAQRRRPRPAVSSGPGPDQADRPDN